MIAARKHKSPENVLCTIDSGWGMRQEERAMKGDSKESQRINNVEDRSLNQ